MRPGERLEKRECEKEKDGTREDAKKREGTDKKETERVRGKECGIEYWNE